MRLADAVNGRPHLFAAAVAVVLSVATLFAGRAVAVQRERNTVAALAPELLPLKIQGAAFQRAAAQTRDVLLFYGSSEVLGPKEWRAADFFRAAPTGFQVSAVGKPGATSLILLQKIGALDRELRGKKVAISLSSSWFLGNHSPYWYDGNFSRVAASALIFASGLDVGLKREIAARMIQYPRSLEETPLLEFALRRLASGNRLDELVFCAVSPLPKLEDAIFKLQDHFAALRRLRGQKSSPPRHPQTLDWAALIAKADAASSVPEEEELTRVKPGRKQQADSRDERFFRARMNESLEWRDFELLLRTLTEIHAQPLLISTPIDGRFYDAAGVSPSARQDFYQRIRALAQRYHFVLVDFQEHDEDIRFLDRRELAKRHVHLSARGWIFYDQLLDDFFHDRLPRP
jgi:D-alanine transfer protein